MLETISHGLLTRNYTVEFENVGQARATCTSGSQGSRWTLAGFQEEDCRCQGVAVEVPILQMHLKREVLNPSMNEAAKRVEN